MAKDVRRCRARYYGIRSVTLPNVRLGMRNPPTATDWRRFWNATAAEPVLRADIRATRRKERRRLQREWQQACQGKPASSKWAAIPPDLVKAASLRRQLDAWVDDDCGDGEGGPSDRTLKLEGWCLAVCVSWLSVCGSPCWYGASYDLGPVFQQHSLSETPALD